MPSHAKDDGITNLLSDTRYFELDFLALQPVCVQPLVQGLVSDGIGCLGETGPLSQGVQVGRKALRICNMNCMEVRKKRPRGSKKRPRGFK
jgi:hypothetical protein